jgi:outer membrane protein, multidrug efflux system
VLCGSTLLLCQCSSTSPGSQFDRVAEITPESWAAQREAKAGLDLKWTGQFRSAELQSLLEAAKEHNLDLKIAASRLAQAQTAIQQARSAGLPMLDLILSPQRQKQNFVGFPLSALGGGGSAPASTEPQVTSNLVNTYRLTGQVQWELDLWGRIRAGTAAAVAAKEAADQDFRAAQASVGAAVVRAWLVRQENLAQANLATKAEQLANDTAQALEERFRSGQDQNGAGSLGAQVRLARSDAATAAASRLEREQAARQAERALAELCGSYPAAKNAKASPTFPTTDARPPAGLPSELLLRRPDILAAERRLAAQQARMKEAKRAIFPRLSLTANAGGSSNALRDVLNSDFGIWSLGGNVVQSILTGGQVRSEIAKRTAEESEALGTLQKTVLGAFREVEDALDAESTLASREAAVAEASKLATEADTEARNDFRQGIGDILTVLQAQQRAIQAESSLLTLKRLRLENRVQLHQALGGNFSVR